MLFKYLLNIFLGDRGQTVFVFFNRFKWFPTASILASQNIRHRFVVVVFPLKGVASAFLGQKKNIFSS